MDGHDWRIIDSKEGQNPHEDHVFRVPLVESAKPDQLRVFVHSAKGLAQRDTKVHTRTIQCTFNPVWKARLVINDYAPGDSLRIVVRDSDYGFSKKSSVKDDLLGAAHLQFEEVGFAGDVELDQTNVPCRTLDAKVIIKLRPVAREHLSKGQDDARDD